MEELDVSIFNLKWFTFINDYPSYLITDIFESHSFKFFSKRNYERKIDIQAELI